MAFATSMAACSLHEAPPDLADRLESLFTLSPPDGAAELERLTDETRAILVRRGLLPT